MFGREYYGLRRYWNERDAVGHFESPQIPQLGPAK